MALTLLAGNENTASLDEVVDFLQANKIDPRDEEALASTAPMLKALHNNRCFLADKLAGYLKDYKRFPDDSNYGSQVLMLHSKRDEPFFVRACLWLSGHEHMSRKANIDTYYQPHDHNFNFITLGYFGPGYRSRYFEYDYERVVGYPGEHVPLKFVEETNLSDGKIMLYRALHDVHDQSPPQSLSVSINIMERSLRTRVADQYAFELPSSAVSRYVNRTGAAPLFLALAYCGAEEDKALIRDISRKHPSPRMRFYALKSLAHAAKTSEKAIEVLSSVEPGDPLLLRQWAKVHISRIEKLA